MYYQDKKSLEKLVAEVKKQGLKIYILKHNQPKEPETYGYITNGKDVLYWQYGDFGGVSFSKKTDPNKYTGSGWRVYFNSTEEDSYFDFQNIDFKKELENHVAPHWLHLGKRAKELSFKTFEDIRKSTTWGHLEEL